MNITGRWPALVLIPAAVAAMVAIDDGYQRPAPAAIDVPLAAQGLGPVASTDEVISSTWFCAGGTADASGQADHVVRIVNAGSEDLAGTVTAIPNQPEVVPPPPADPVETQGSTTTSTTIAPTTTSTSLPPAPDEAVITVEVASGDSTEIRLADHIESSFVAGLVELDGGGAVVEHTVSGDLGADTAPCASQPSDSWYFAAGQTTVDANMFLTFFNPFPDPAVIDVTFRSEEDLRSPEEFQGLIIPARSVLARDIGSFVTRRAHVSTSVVARSGRLVVDRLMLFNGTVDQEGLDVTLGAAKPAEVWYSPDGAVSEGISERFVVFNPGDTRAEVDLTLEPLDDAVEQIEPFQLTIPPQGFQELVVSDEARIGTAIENAGVEFLRHGTRIVSLNEVPVVVERTIVGQEGSGRAGFDITPATPLLTTRAVLVPDTEADGGVLVVQNRDGEAAAEVTISSTSGDALETIEVAPATTVDVPLTDVAGADGPLIVESSIPVAMERRRFSEDRSQTTHTLAVPFADAITRPTPPG